MKLAFLTESLVDEAALRVLVAGVLGAPFFQVQAGLRARGWPNVAQLLPAVITHLHYNTATDALVVVVDTDDSPLHAPEHDLLGAARGGCRLCQLRTAFHRVARRLRPYPGREHVLRCIGVASPAIEAWYLAGRAPEVTEAHWREGLGRGRPPYSRAELKVRVYGTDRPSLAHATACALREVARHRADTRRLESDFPGFAALAADLRAAFATQNGH